MKMQHRILASGIAALFTALTRSIAADWVGDTSQDWNDPLNWSGDVYPTGQNAIVNVGAGSFPIISANTTSVVDTLVGQGAGNSGRVDHRTGTHSTGSANWTFIGDSGGTGTYNLADTNTAGGGVTGFAQGLGTLNYGNRLYVGRGGGTGTLNINTSGALNFTSGANDNGVYVGVDSGSQGFLNFESGTLNSFESYVGRGGATGLVNMTGGIWNTTAFSVIGQDTGGSGTFNMSGGTWNQNHTNVLALGQAGGTGAFTMSGSSRLNDQAIVDTNNRSTNKGNLLVGRSGVGTGTFTMNGNSVARLRRLSVADTAGSTGFVHFNDNAAATLSEDLFVGLGGTGTVNLNSGTVTMNTGWAFVGQNAGSNGTLNVNGGTFAPATGTMRLYIGNSGAGTLTVTGGNIAGLDQFVIASNAGSAGTVQLNGGVVQAAAFIAGAGTANVNFNGGTVRAISGNGNFFNAFTTGNSELQAGGLVFDSNGNTPTATNSFDGAGGITKLGSGTLTLTSAGSTYGGVTTIAAGTLSVPAVANGGGASTLGASSSAATNLVFDGGALRYTGGTAAMDRNFTINPGKSATFDVSTPGSILTLSGGSAATNGGLTKIGGGTLSLTGTNLYTGTTNANAGVLAASGSYPGAFAVNSGGHLTALSLAAGTLTVPTLALNAGSNVDFEFGAGATLNGGHDIIAIGNASGLGLTSTGLFLYQTGGTTAFTANGTYTLFDYTTAFTGTLVSGFTIANSQVGKLYSIANNPGATTIELSIADTVITSWKTNGSGLWSGTGNWTAGVPDSFGAIATFPVVALETAGTKTVTVDGAKTVGVIVFDNGANPYLLSGGAGNTITLNNGSGTPLISQVQGSHTIAAPLSLIAATNAAAVAGSTLTLSGAVSGTGSLNVTDAGTVVLTGANSYGSTSVNSGTLNVGNGGASGSLGSGPVTLGAGTQLILNRANAASVANSISGTGTLRADGTGTLTYTGSATHTGATTVNGPFINQGTVNGTASLSVAADTGSNASFTNAGTATTVIPGPVNIASGAGSIGTVNVTGGTFTASGTTFVGQGGGGSFAISGGATSLQQVDIAPSGTGAMTVSGGALVNPLRINVGQGGTSASYNQTSGTVNVSSWTAVGLGSAGQFNLSGGTYNANGGFETGADNIGTATISGTGILNTSNFEVPSRNGGATSAATVSGGAITATGAITLGGRDGNTTASGTLNQTAGTITAATVNIGGASVGTWRQSGGTTRTTGNFEIGTTAGANLMELNGPGTLTVDGELWVGQAAGSNATFNMSAGTVNAGNWIAVGRDGATGALNFSGGVINKRGLNHTIIGSLSGIGTVTQTGGQFNSTASSTLGGAGGIRLGENGGGSGLWDISGGNATADFISVGWIGGGTGELKVSGTGVVTAESSVIVGEGGTGTVNLNGGRLNTSFVNSGTSAATLTFNGGTLQARADQADFIRGFTNNGIHSAILLEGPGGTIDSNGFRVKVAAGNVFSGSDVSSTDGQLGTVLTIKGDATLFNDTDKVTLQAQVGDGVNGYLSIRVLSGGWLDDEVGQVLDSLTIDSGGYYELSSLNSPPGAPSLAAAGSGELAVGAIPEPGSAVLLLGGIATLLGLRRRRA